MTAPAGTAAPARAEPRVCPATQRPGLFVPVRLFALAPVALDHRIGFVHESLAGGYAGSQVVLVPLQFGGLAVPAGCAG